MRKLTNIGTVEIFQKLIIILLPTQVVEEKILADYIILDVFRWTKIVSKYLIEI